MTTDTEQPVPAPPPPPGPSLGRAVGRGMSFTVANSVLSKVLSFATTAVLGWLLEDHDFGLYAMAFSIAAFLQFFRDGGVVQLLVQRGEAEYQRLIGPVFWMAFAFNSATAALLSLVAPAAASLKEAPQLAVVVWVLALNLPLMTPSVVFTARLQMRMRFGYINTVSFGSSIIRYAGTIGLAAAGFGPLSFVLPMPVIAVYEGVAYYLAVRESPWRRAPMMGMWRELFGHGKWLIFFAFSIATLNQGGYLVIGAIVDFSRVGVFAFAFQLISQVDALLGTFGTVLFPALTRLNDDPARQQSAILRAVRVLMFLACPAALGLAAVVAPVEQLIWHGKWAAIVWPVQALSLFYAARILITVPNAALQARGLFRANAVLTLMAGVGLMIAAGLGAAWGNASANPETATPNRIAECMGVAYGVFCTGFSLWGLAALGLRPGRVLGAIAPSWVAAIVAAAATLALDHAVRGRMVELAGDLAARLAAWNVPVADKEWAPLAVDGLLRLMMGFAAYCLCYGVVQRVIAPAWLREAIAIFPGRLSRLGMRAALLRSEA